MNLVFLKLCLNISLMYSPNCIMIRNVIASWNLFSSNVFLFLFSEGGRSLKSRLPDTRVSHNWLSEEKEHCFTCNINNIMSWVMTRNNWVDRLSASLRITRYCSGKGLYVWLVLQENFIHVGDFTHRWVLVSNWIWTVVCGVTVLGLFNPTTVLTSPHLSANLPDFLLCCRDNSPNIS